jgi:hypothetical protein
MLRLYWTTPASAFSFKCKVMIKLIRLKLFS